MILHEKQPFISATTRKVFIGLALACGALVTALSLLSYGPTDLSATYDSATTYPTHNWLGSSGAYLASLLLYVFGCAAWGVPLIIGYILRVYLFNLAWKRETDRIAALGVGMLTCCCMGQFYGLDWYGAIHPGGLIGHALLNSLRPCMAPPEIELLLFILAWAATIVVVRFSVIVYLHPLKKLLLRLPMRRLLNSLSTLLYTPIGLLTQRRSKTATTTAEPTLHTADHREDHVPEMSRTADQFEDLMEEPVQEPLHEPIKPASPSAAQVTPATLSPEVTYEAEDDSDSDTEPVVHYKLPSSELFAPIQETVSDDELRIKSKERAVALENKLERFGIKGKITSITQGPVVTLFEYQPSVDTRISTILAREDDLALALQALSLRIIAPIPGRSVVGFEVAHAKRKMVMFSQLIKSSSYSAFKGQLPLILGKDTLGANVVIDLAAAPHLLVAGSTGAGKSVGLHAMLTSLLCAKTPDEIKLILIDPKRLEFSAYSHIAHLLFPVVTDPKRAIAVLKWAVEKMEDRYAHLSQAGARNAADYNKTRSPKDDDYMPYIVIIIDELADLMMTAGKDVEFLIARLAQMARAAGMHLIAATQRPSVDVITGLIKVNFPSRIAYKVTSKVDSRTILDMTGAEKLLGKGDMLYLDPKGAVQRVHGVYVTDEEINAVIEHIKAERQPEYQELTTIKKVEDQDDADELFQDVLAYIENKDEISISLLQRVFRVGYNRSARIIDQLEATGHILPADGGKMRKVAKET